MIIHLVERDKPKQIGIGWTNVAAVAMEAKKGGYLSFINFCSFLRCFMKFDERNQNNLKIPPFLFPWQLRQSLS
jgi:hypothetical protein